MLKHDAELLKRTIRDLQKEKSKEKKSLKRKGKIQFGSSQLSYGPL